MFALRHLNFSRKGEYDREPHLTGVLQYLNSYKNSLKQAGLSKEAVGLTVLRYHFSWDFGSGQILTGSRLISVPGEPQNVNARPINSSTIEVSWDPPIDKDKNGVIRGYQIHVQPKNMVSHCHLAVSKESKNKMCYKHTKSKILPQSCVKCATKDDCPERGPFFCWRNKKNTNYNFS